MIIFNNFKDLKITHTITNMIIAYNDSRIRLHYSCVLSKVSSLNQSIRQTIDYLSL